MTTRTDPEKHKEQVRAANRARHRATKRLIANHRAEFNAMYMAEAEKEGVTPKPLSREPSTEVATLRAQMEEMRAEFSAQLAALTSGQGKRR